MRHFGRAEGQSESALQGICRHSLPNASGRLGVKQTRSLEHWSVLLQAAAIGWGAVIKNINHRKPDDAALHTRSWRRLRFEQGAMWMIFMKSSK
jgi:hypothetical protein